MGNYPRFLSSVLQSDLLKFETSKFNIIINIINITFQSNVLDLRFLDISLQKYLTLLDLSLF
jgi:hypothetical protein